MPRKEKPCKKAWRKKECLEHAPACAWKGKCVDPSKELKDDDGRPRPKSCYNLPKALCITKNECLWNRGCKPLKTVIGSPIIEKEKEKDNRDGDSLSSADKKKLKQIRLKMALRKALSPVINKNPGDVSKRMKLYHIVKNYMTKVPACLTRGQNNAIYLGNKIDLTKRIGTPSVYGAVYLTKGMGFGRLLKVATKCMSVTRENTKEIKVLEKLTNDVKDSGFLHFPLFYFNKKCNVPLCKPGETNCPSQFLFSPYYVVMSELADGDLQSWLHEKPRTLLEYTSALFQIYMAIGKFQSTGYTHHDAHWGNFLYHKTAPGGYWWYQVGGFNFYIKNTGQLWVIWDFGFATKSRAATTSYRTEDFERITHAFRQKTSALPGWMDAKKITYPDALRVIARDMGLLMQYKRHCTLGNILYNYVQMVSKRLSHPLPELAMITTRPPADQKVLNTSPFVLM